MTETNTLSMSESELTEKIQSGELKICVVGIGRIGLPTALSFADSGLTTIGVDINKNLVEMINEKKFPLKDEPGYDVMFDRAMNENKFYATTSLEEAVSKSNVVILTLPTPMDSNHVPDYSALKSVGKQLHNFISKGTLVIVESTVEPGFIENDFLKFLQGSENSLQVGSDFSLGVSPETANPGQILLDFERLPRLIGGIDEKTKNLILKIYKHVFTVELIPMPNCKTANAVKLTTNVFRDLNIAFINELAQIFEKAGIDIMTVLDAAKSKYNFQPHFPGPGVGGPCLPVNSYQMINFAKNHSFDGFKLVEQGRKINENMSKHTIDLLEDSLNEAKKSFSDSTVLLLGASYKPDVKDIQLSPIEDIIKILQEKNSNVLIYDPYFKNSEIFGIKTSNDLVSSLKDSDALIIVTAHKEFHDLESSFLKSKMKTPIVIDSRCLIDPHIAKNNGLIYRAIGRGKL